jgi:hypothetical protein
MKTACCVFVTIGLSATVHPIGGDALLILVFVTGVILTEKLNENTPKSKT